MDERLAVGVDEEGHFTIAPELMRSGFHRAQPHDEGTPTSASIAYRQYPNRGLTLSGNELFIVIDGKAGFR